MDHKQRLSAALRNASVDRPPLWFMRQAGRYLPEYRAVREKVSFLDLCRDPALGCEVTLQPLRRFDLDAAIVFSDILTVPEALGFPVDFEGGKGPVLLRRLVGEAEVGDLEAADPRPHLQVVPETLRLFQAARPDVPILGFAGAPFTLLCYLTEGKGSSDWLSTKRLLFQHPELAQRALDRLADVVGDYLQAQVQAGAFAVQLFDTWAGVLSAEDYRRWALPAAARALARVSGAPRIYFTRDSAPFLPWLAETGADAIGLDWRVSVRQARAVLGALPVQGNLDPVALFAPPAEVRRRVTAICDEAGPTGHIFNLGHGILPGTPIEGVQAMVEAVLARGPVRG